MAAKKAKKARADKPQSSSEGRIQVSGDALPRRTLEQAIRLPEILHTTYAGKTATRTELAGTMGVGVRSANTHYLFAAAQAYGLVTKAGEDFSLSETGRKIVAPTFDGEDREGRVKALLTPSVLSKFYTDYNGHQIPGPAHFPNVLESRFQVPRDRIEEAISILVENARYAGILKEGGTGEQPRIDLASAGSILPAQSTEPPLTVAADDGSPTVAAQQDSSDWDQSCFFITPIGEDGSPQRKHADMVLKHLVEPVAKKLGLKVVRADKIERSGIITQQIFEHLMRARLCVADLSFSNPNAFYELGVRHVFMRPTIQLIRKGDPIPFDVSQGRTIIVDTSDVYTVTDRLESARRELTEHMKPIVEARSDAPSDDNPVHAYLPGIRITIPR